MNNISFASIILLAVIAAGGCSCTENLQTTKYTKQKMADIGIGLSGAPGQSVKNNDLVGVSLSGADFRKTSFIRSNMMDSKYLIEQLHPRFMGVKLEACQFDNANLSYADFRCLPQCSRRDPVLFTKITGCSFDHALMIGVRMNGVVAKNCSFRYTTLDEADFQGFDILGNREEYYVTTQLINCDFTGASLKSCSFGYVGHCKFVKADLSGAVIGGILSGCDFSKANLSGADFSKAIDMGTASFKEAVYDSKTKWPHGFDPSKSGAISTSR